ELLDAFERGSRQITRAVKLTLNTPTDGVTELGSGDFVENPQTGSDPSSVSNECAVWLVRTLKSDKERRHASKIQIPAASLRHRAGSQGRRKKGQRAERAGQVHV